MKNLLIVNAGSSSLKFAVFEQPLNDQTPPRYRGQVDNIGEKPKIVIVNAAGDKLLEGFVDTPASASIDEQHAASLTSVLEWLSAHDVQLAGVGHRVLHGGDKYNAPLLIDPAGMEVLEALCSLGPLHQPHNLRPIRMLSARLPDLPQVACFDTAFHQTQSRLSSTYALPRELTESGIKRYGFHGQSYEYVSLQLPGVLGDKAHGAVVVAHLGNGASMCAMRDLKCVTTSMGFTALEGLMMGTRTGSIDPGILLYLMEHRGYDVASLSRLLYRESGLLGVSGISNDMRTLEASDKPEAREAIDLFCYRVARDIGSMAVALGGFDALVFTGGIGENGCAIRTQIVKHLAWMGMAIDEKANVRKSTAFRMDTPESRIAVAVVPTNEEWMIASHTAHLIASVAKLATA